MPKFKVKGTDILYNGKCYPEGETVEIKEKDAEKLADYLEALPETKKEKQPEKKTQEQKTGEKDKDKKGEGDK